MCYDIISCPRCGAILDEFSWDEHRCKFLEPVEESRLVMPMELLAKSKSKASR